MFFYTQLESNQPDDSWLGDTKLGKLMHFAFVDGHSVDDTKSVAGLNAAFCIDQTSKDEAVTNLDETIYQPRGIVLSRSVLQSPPSTTYVLRASETVYAFRSGHTRYFVFQITINRWFRGENDT